MSPMYRWACIETTTYCNHTCVYCPLGFLTPAVTVMPIEDFAAIISKIKRIPVIRLDHYNEPLLDPHFSDRISIIETKTKSDILLYTNLSVLSSDALGAILRARDRIKIVVNLPTCFQNKYKILHGRNDLQRVQNNLDMLLDLALNIEVNVQTNQHTGPMDLLSVMRFIRGRCPVIPEQSRTISGLVQINRKTKPTPLPEGSMCRARKQDTLHIGVTGEVFWCGEDYYKRHRFGSLLTQTLDEIIESDSMVKAHQFIRGEAEDATMPCHSCEFYGEQDNHEYF